VVKLYIFVVKDVQYFTEELSKVFFGHDSTALFCLLFSFFVRSLIVVSDRCAEFLNALFPGVDPGGGGEGGLLWGNQSKLRAGEAGGKRGKSRATKSRLILMLRLIG